MECEKHPLTYNGYTPRRFKEEFEKWSSSYIKDFLEELCDDYKRQSEGDRKAGRKQLSKNLETLATSIYLASKDVKTKKGTTPLRTPKDLAKGFGNTNYFYQKQVFYELRKELPIKFEDTINAINKVCKSCKNYMKPYTT